MMAASGNADCGSKRFGRILLAAGAFLLLPTTVLAEPNKPIVFHTLNLETFARAITDAISGADYELKPVYPPDMEEACASGKLGEPAVLLSSLELPAYIQEICGGELSGGIAKAELGFVTHVLVQKASDPPLRLSADQLYRALAKRIPAKDGFEANEARQWSDVDPELPNLPIDIILPSDGMSDRSIFDAEVLVGGCRDYEAVKLIFASESRLDVCVELRDGVASEVADAAARLIALRQKGSGSIAFVPDSIYESNQDSLRVIPFNGVLPTPEDIIAEDYTLTTPLYVYAHEEQVSGDQQVPAIRNWFLEAISERAIGDAGYLRQYGFISVPTAVREWQRKEYTE